MTPPEIPLLRLSGTHRDVGEQLGLVRGESLRRAATFEDQPIPEGRTRREQLALADRYREVTRAAYPWYLDEVEGAAEAAEVDPLALFATVIEEIWYVPYARRLEGRCTDLVAGPPATADGHVIVAHNNDVTRSYQEGLVAIEWTIPDEPRVLTISNDLWLSCGWNDAGITMAGNELAPLDERIGIPRMIQYRSMLRQPTMGRAVGEALRHDRASSYNQVLVSADEVVNVEGSATDAELTTLDERGHLVHTNHYVCERMLRYEGDHDYVPHSYRRYERAAELLGSTEPGSVSMETMRGFLSDHEGAPDSLCRHPELHCGEGSATVFWWISDVTDMRLEFGRGNPCDSVAQSYGFPEAAETAA